MNLRGKRGRKSPEKEKISTVAIRSPARKPFSKAYKGEESGDRKKAGHWGGQKQIQTGKAEGTVHCHKESESLGLRTLWPARCSD